MYMICRELVWCSIGDDGASPTIVMRLSVKMIVHVYILDGPVYIAPKDIHEVVS